MKIELTLIVIGLCISCCVQAQSIIRSTLGAGGKSQLVTANGKTYFVSQSIGQASVIGTSSSQGYTIRQGFQQPPSSFIVSPPSVNDFAAQVYPNPFSQSIKIAFGDPVKKDIYVIIHDITGRIVLNRAFAASQELEMSLQDMKSGDYILRIMVGQKHYTTSVIKQ